MKSNACASSISSDTLPEGGLCSQCGLELPSLGDGDFDCDRCDKCGTFLHFECIHTSVDREWSLCRTCFHTHGHSATRDTQLECDKPASELQASQASQLGEVQHTPLDVTLEYMVKFLEGDHAKSDQVSKAKRDEVLKHIRATMAWQSGPRSPTEVKAKGEELNNMMMEIVQQV